MMLVSLTAAFTATLIGVSACGSGDGVPAVAIKNSFDQNSCIVQARFQNYSFDVPLQYQARSPSREVTVGDPAHAYAVVVEPVDGSCGIAANQCGGTLWETKNLYQPGAGEILIIEFSPADKEIDKTENFYAAAAKGFRRLYLEECEKVLRDGGPDGEPDGEPESDAADAEGGTDAEPDAEPDADQDAG